MIHKLIGLIKYILIGHKILYLFFILPVTLTSCWEKKHDYFYEIKFKNVTSDTLLLVLGVSDSDYYPDSIIIQPNFDTNAEFLGGFNVDEGENIVINMFYGSNKPFIEQARVFRNDSIKVTWNGPAREMADSIHHFYNYNSWDSWLVDDDDGIVMFTIYESDLKD